MFKPTIFGPNTTQAERAEREQNIKSFKALGIFYACLLMFLFLFAGIFGSFPLSIGISLIFILVFVWLLRHPDKIKSIAALSGRSLVKANDFLDVVLHSLVIRIAAGVAIGLWIYTHFLR